jgi:ABC-type antimicrobial peptide transport system permease subunit
MRKTILTIISIIIIATLVGSSVTAMDLRSIALINKDQAVKDNAISEESEIVQVSDAESIEDLEANDNDISEESKEIECLQCQESNEVVIAGEAVQTPPGGCLECNEIVNVITNYAFDYANSKISLPEDLIFEGNWIDIIQDILRGVGQTFKAVRQWIGYFTIGMYLGLQEHDDEIPFTVSEAVSGSVIVFIIEFVLGGYGGPMLAATGATLEVLQYLQALCNGGDYIGLTDLSLLASEPVSTQSNTIPAEVSTQSNTMSTETTSIQSTQSGSMSL